MIRNKIADATRQDIIDLLVVGFKDTITGEHVKCYWSGSLQEQDFLARLYDLNQWSSTDSRFKDFYSDIRQHRSYNDDWAEDWVFYDSKFALKTGTDDNWLTFMCEMFHPAVRDERNSWKRLLRLINNLLAKDGYELYEVPNVSGIAKYGYRATTARNIVVENQANSLIVKFDSEYIRTQINAMNESINTMPYDAIGKAKELLESCCKTILGERGVTVDKNWEVPRLTKETCKVLKLTPDSIDDSAKASETIKNLLGALSSIAGYMAELRNPYGSGHGKAAKFKGLSPRHARLAVGSAVTAIHFIWETHEEQKERTNK